MAVKTITIDMEAYTLLAHRKRAGQSFSQVIKEHFGRQPTVAGFRKVLAAVSVEEDTLKVMEGQVRDRRVNPARAARR
jgi:predicted CopG family antitoxin